MKTAWQFYFSDKNNRSFFIVSFAALALILFSFLFFLTWNESRSGPVFNDPVLNLFSPRDLSVLTFSVTYIVAITGLIISLKDPSVFITLIRAYAVLTLMRMISLCLLPLEPPAGIIPLKDLFLRASFYSGRDNLRDLFFSGHVATIFLFVFAFRDKKLKLLFTSAAVCIGLLLIIQHVHYSIDVAVAPFMAWGAVLLQGLIGLPPLSPPKRRGNTP